MSKIKAPPPSKRYGWLPPAERSADQIARHDAIVAAMPAFQIYGSWAPAGDKATVWEFAKQVRGGKHLPALYQSIGSCVGHGKAKAEWYTLMRAIAGGLNYRQVIPYEPYGYAQSRVAAGISGNEDGSTGSGAAQAAMHDGVLPNDFDGLPAPMKEDGSDTLKTPGSIDKQWGQRGAPSQFVKEGRMHLIKSCAPVRSAGDVATAIQTGYAVTIASDWGGQMQVKPQGNPAVLLNPHADQWMHQMMIAGWWKHPQFGEVFNINNSWGADAHGQPPDDSPPGSFWVLAKDVDYIVRQNDSFAYSPFENGFPAPEPQLIDWIFK